MDGVDAFLYVASFVPGGTSEGIHLYSWDSVHGASEYIGATRGVENPLFLASDPAGRWLYAADCAEDSDHGFISSYARDSATGGLTHLNRVSSRGVVPVFLQTSRTGASIFVANCGPFTPESAGRTVAVFPVGRDGSVGEAWAVHEHNGSSVDPERQTSPHPHSIALAPDGATALVPDLGIDAIVVYAFDETRQLLEPRPSRSTRVARGSGPRHIKFHPNGRYVYVITEIANTIVAFSYEARGELSELQTITTLGDERGSDRAAADLCVHPSGRFLYCSNRVEQTIATFTIDQGTGLLTAAGHVPTSGASPRSLAVDPEGRYLLVANEYSATVNAFRIDLESGALEPAGRVCSMAGPACLHLVRRNPR
jgi:6-phosphogluconolactonase